MSKIKAIICSLFITFVLLCGIIVPILPTQVFAEEQEVQKYSLLSPQYNQTPSETLAKYNITTAQTHTFTPFDFENEERMAGMSFVLPTDERKQILNQYVLLDEVSNLSLTEDISLNLWIYFDKIYLHNLTITLELENSESLTWYFSTDQLYMLLGSNNGLSLTSLPYGFVKFDLPLKKAEATGEYKNENILISPNKLKINFASTTSEVDDFSNLIFYDVYLAKSNNDEISVEKQHYRFYSLNFFKQDVLDSLVVGDSLYIPSKESVINYAWDGDSDLYELSNKQTPYVTWKVLLKEPDAENKVEYKSFGDKITFDKEGVYQLYYQCINTSLSNDKPIISESIEIVVNELRPVIFRLSKNKIQVGKTYTLYMDTSSVFNTVSDFTITSTDGLEINYLGDGVVKIKATKEGKHKITASVNATRVVDSTQKEYSSQFQIQAVEIKEDDNTVFKIVLWSILGTIFAVFVGIGIKSLVKANKNDVK